MATHQPKRLGEVLVESGVITERQLDEALARKRETKRRLGSTLVSMGLATEAQICRAVAEQQGIPVVDLRSFVPEAGAVRMIPAELALEHCLLPLRVQSGRMTLVMADPFDMTGYDAAWRAARCATVDRVMAPETEVIALIQEVYGASPTDEGTLRGLVPSDSVEILADEGAGRVPGSGADFDASDAINALVGGAAEMGATHVRVEPSGRTTTIRYRVDGKLRRAAILPRGTHSALIGRLRSLFHVDPNQPSSCQEGHASLQLGQHQVGLRLALVPTVNGEAAVVRILDPRQGQMRIDQLGFSEPDLAAILDLLALPNGVILVAGPEDAGVSTTLYAILNHLSDEAASLVSIENPVESMLLGVTQIEVNERAGMSWAEALRAAGRLDPDVLMLSDMLDPETAGLALRAAMRGQLVLAGIRAESAAAAMVLLADMGMEPYLLGSTLRAVIGQRLVRRVCPSCQVAAEPDPRSVGRLELTPAELAGKTLARGQGCSSCGATGYQGRIGIFEVARITRPLREQIIARAAALDIAHKAREGGMRFLRDDALAKVFAGITTLSEAAGAVPASD